MIIKFMGKMTKIEREKKNNRAYDKNILQKEA